MPVEPRGDVVHFGDQRRRRRIEIDAGSSSSRLRADSMNAAVIAAVTTEMNPIAGQHHERGEERPARDGRAPRRRSPTVVTVWTAHQTSQTELSKSVWSTQRIEDPARHRDEHGDCRDRQNAARRAVIVPDGRRRGAERVMVLAMGTRSATERAALSTIGHVRREFSAGGVVVRKLRGGWHVAAIHPRGRKPGVWALPEGEHRSRRGPGRDGGARGPEETGVDGKPRSRSSAT